MCSLKGMQSEGRGEGHGGCDMGNFSDDYYTSFLTLILAKFSLKLENIFT